MIFAAASPFSPMILPIRAASVNVAHAEPSADKTPHKKKVLNAFAAKSRFIYYSIFKMSEKPVISKTSITESPAFLTVILPDLFIVF